MIGTDRGISLSGAVREMLASSEDTDVYTKNTLNYVNEVSSAVKSTNPADPLNSAEAVSYTHLRVEPPAIAEMMEL